MIIINCYKIKTPPTTLQIKIYLTLIDMGWGIHQNVKKIHYAMLVMNYSLVLENFRQDGEDVKCPSYPLFTCFDSLAAGWICELI